MSKQLRPYQQQLLAAVRAKLKTGKNCLVQLPTGAGKSLCFATLIRDTQVKNPSFRCVVIVNRVSLALQIERALLETGVNDVGLCSGTLNRFEQHRAAVVGVFNTLARCALPTYHLAILDEAHRAGSLKNGTGYYSVAKDVQTLGFTATPYNQSGFIYGDKADSAFETLDFQASITELTLKGYLCRARLTGPIDTNLVTQTAGLSVVNGEFEQEALGTRVTQDSEKIRQQVDDIIRRTHNRSAVVIACVNIKHARMVFEALGQAGQPSCIVTSDDNFDTRQDETEAFTSGRVRYLVFVSIVSEGFDDPRIDCVVLLRPTRSACLYVQTVGRGLRIWPGKQDCLVLDYADVVATCGPLDRPYIRGQSKRNTSVEVALDIRVVRCKGCGEFYFPERGTYPPCPTCNTPNPPPKPPRLKIKGQADATSALYATEAQSYIALPWVWYRVEKVVAHVGPQMLTVVYITDQGPVRQYFQIPVSGRTVPAHAMGYWARLKAVFTEFFGCDKSMTGPQILRRCEDGKLTHRPSMVMAVQGLHHKHGEVRQLSTPVKWDAVTTQPAVEPTQLAL